MGGHIDALSPEETEIVGALFFDGKDHQRDCRRGGPQSRWGARARRLDTHQARPEPRLKREHSFDGLALP